MSDWLMILIVGAMFAFGLYASHCAYFNGASDGYHFSRDPAHPGAVRAGRYICKYMGHLYSDIPEPGVVIIDVPRVVIDEAFIVDVAMRIQESIVNDPRTAVSLVHFTSNVRAAIYDASGIEFPKGDTRGHEGKSNE